MSEEAPRPDDALLGSLVDGRYRVERVVGAGGFGKVYEAFHVGLGSPVALKVLALPDRLKPDQLAKLCGAFLEEARTLKRLRHPGIVAALDVGLLPADGARVRLPYLVMEWCGGPTLKQMLEERGAPMPLEEAWALFEPLLEALAHAHAAGVAHRDVKPSNVLLEPTGSARGWRARLIDFGIAKIVAPDESAGTGATHTTSGSSPFTPRYAAPEQLAQARTGPWTDVYAAALLFVELVVGAPAMGDDEDAGMAAFDPTRPTPKAFAVDVGPLEPVLAKALALKPAERHPDAAALRQAMREIMGDGSAAPFEARLVAPVPRAQDETAPPSSHTLRTLSDPQGTLFESPRAQARGGRGRVLLGSVLAFALTLGGAGAVQRSRHAFPFSQARVRDITAAELDARVSRLGFNGCTKVTADRTRVYNCATGTVSLSDFSYGFDEPTLQGLIGSNALTVAKVWGSATFARDGTHVLLVGAPKAPEGDAVAALDTVLGGAHYDERKEVNLPAPPPRTAETHARLSRWIAEDLFAAIAAAGVQMTTSSTSNALAVASLQRGNAMGSAQLQFEQGRTQLALTRLQSNQIQGVHFVYALEGDTLLTLTQLSEGTELENLDLLKRLLAGAHVDEIGAYPPRP